MDYFRQLLEKYNLDIDSFDISNLPENKSNPEVGDQDQEDSTGAKPTLLPFAMDSTAISESQAANTQNPFMDEEDTNFTDEYEMETDLFDLLDESHGDEFKEDDPN